MKYKRKTKEERKYRTKEAVSWASGGLRFGSSGEAARLVAGEDSFPMELSARLELLEQLRVLAHIAAHPKCVGPSRLGLQSVPDRLVWLPPLQQGTRRNGLARLLLLRAGTGVLGSRRVVNGSYQSQAARAARRWLRHRQCCTSV